MAPQGSIEDQARAPTKYIAQAAGKTHALIALTSSLYNTALMAIIRKRDDSSALLFPQCFQYVLDTQLPSGGWGRCHFEIDDIMNTHGRLLALKHNSGIQCETITQPIDARIVNAVEYLNPKLHDWGVGSCNYVGFAIYAGIPGEGATVF